MKTIVEIAAAVKSGSSTITPTEDAVEQVGRLEAEVQAWVEFDAEVALAAAASAESGPLAGVPTAIKDIFDVAGMPTRFGAAAFAWRDPAADSTVVAKLRAAGAVILGKTATTTFAYLDPAPTRNPWNLDHTPGGSSSGSAAAVAAGMASLAIGSQTVGSVLRPAAYCGIIGLKPAHGWVSLDGVYPLAPSLDHAGLFTRSVADAAIAYRVLAADATSSSGAFSDGKVRPSFGLLRAYSANTADAEVAAHLDAMAARAGEAGAWVEQVSLPFTPEQVHDVTNRVLAYEAARVHAEAFARHAAEYPPNLRGLVERGLAMTDSDYQAAQDERDGIKRVLAPILGTFDALLLPVAPTTAPRTLSSTGSSIFCSLASLSGCPAISLPSGLGEQGLPLAVQLIGLETLALLDVASWLGAALAFNLVPPLAARA